MTIAACYLSGEGVILGADSTSTMYVAGPVPGHGGSEHHFNFAQKIFQIGEQGTLGMTMWGLGSLGTTSYRTLIARLAEDIQSSPPASMAEVADRWNGLFWNAYSATFPDVIQRARHLDSLPSRTADEESELMFYMQTLSAGFCLAGCCLPDRSPQAFQVAYSPNMADPNPPVPQALGSTKFWGCPNLIDRLLYGADFGVLEAIMQSGKWIGTQQDLMALVQPHVLGQPLELPIREAIDWVHASIHATIKTMKFSHLAPVCGGPVEIAVITTDRPFRWVRHKELDAAISSSGF